MPRKKTEVIIDGYHFFLSASRVTVMSKENKDDEELKTIAKLYEDHYYATREGGILPKGKWQWCFNSEGCRKAVYAPLCHIKLAEGRIFCSHGCSNRFRSPKKMDNIIEPVFILPSNPGKAVELKNNSEKPIKTQFQCLKCKATMDKIVGNPSVCSACRETSVFIVVEAPT